MDASVSTRVVSWNDAAEMNESGESDAFVMPSSSGRPCARLVGHDDDLPLPLDDAAVLDEAVDFRDDGRFARLARLEQLHHARQTARDVLGLRRLAGNLREDVAGVDVVAVLHHQMRVD